MRRRFTAQHHVTQSLVRRSASSGRGGGERDVRPLARCEEKRKEWAEHWLCNTEVQRSGGEAVEE